MYLLFFFHLLVVIIIPGAFSITPGDPFPTNFGNKPNRFFTSYSKNVSNKTTSSSVYFSSTNTKLSSINVNNLLFSSTPKSVQETLPIDKKNLMQIAQWTYTEPQTNETRYWYHMAGSPMGRGWILDGILCQGYIRQKPDTIPIESFHSETKDIWTNTLQIESTSLPIGNNQWKYDGPFFYAYKTSMNSSLLKPVWRYWNKISYGTEEVGKPRRSYFRMGDIVDDDLPGWRLDSILFYAFPPHINVTESQN